MTQSNNPSEKIVKANIEVEVRSSYLDYAMSVIVARALPDIRDGLKPVHRRVLFTMNELSLQHNKPFKKCARIVGDCLGKYHPHGDLAVYESLVRMAQDFSLRYPLIEGQGNFGSVDGDNAAAMRYTEARLSEIAEEMLADIDKDTVDFIPNFDNSLKEPVILPSKLPNLLINGSSGIAVGMATNIPPHNMSEIVDATVLLIDSPDADDSAIAKTVKGPDFPTGAMILGTSGIREAYKTGRGRIIIRSVTDIEENKGKSRIIVKEIPYMVNKSQLIEHIVELVKSDQIEGISDIRDESDKKGIRIIIELKKEINPNIVLNRLFKFSKLQVSMSINLLSLVNNEPKTLSLRSMIQEFIKHRRIVVTRRTQFELDKAEQRAHVIIGLIIALNNIDEVIAKIKASKDTKIARAVLMENFRLSEIQADAILDMKLQRLSSLEQEKIKEEQKELITLIKELKEILASEKRILEIIKKELLELKAKYDDKRRTQIAEAEDHKEIGAEELIEEEDVIITISHHGYVKRLPIATYKIQQRGGKGIVAHTTKEEDFVQDIFIASTHSYLLLLTNKGQLYWLKAHEIPEASRQAMGKAIVNLVSLEKDEKITASITTKDFDDKHYLFMITSKGIVKKTQLSEFANPRKNGIRAINIDEGDQLADVMLTDSTKTILIATKEGMALKFNENDVRPMGRASTGVKGIKLRENDEVIGAVISNETKTLLTITEKGFGKRTELSEYRLTGRAGSGVVNIKCTEKNGKVVSIKELSDDDEVMLISQNGIMIRLAAKNISVIGRNTQGVRLMKMEESDKVVAAAKIAVNYE